MTIDMSATTKSLRVELELGESEWGTPRPRARVRVPRGTPHRRLSAALHILAATVEFVTDPAERWGAYLDQRADDSGFVYLELFDGTDDEAARGMEALRAAIGRLGWT